MKLYAIEGNLQKLDGGAMYGNAPREVWKQWSPPDELNRITLACRGLLLETDSGKKILFEAGVGNFFEDKLKERYGITPPEHQLLNSLRAVGVDHTEINAVVLSHLHFDHAGGIIEMVEGQPRLLFPNATFYSGKTHWKRACKPHTRDKASFIPMIIEILEKSGRFTLIDEGDGRPETLTPGLPDGRGQCELAPLVTFSFSHGHTPGLMISTIDLPKGPLAFVADLIPASPWMRTAITMGYDRFPELLIEEKQALLEKLAAAGGSVLFTHDPGFAAGRVIRDPRGQFSAQPIALEALL